MIDAQKLLEEKMNYHLVSPADVLAFEQAMKGFVGVHYVPVLVKDNSNIGVAKRTYICIGTVVGNDKPTGIYEVTIQRVSSLDSKWELVNIKLLFLISEDITIDPLSIDEVAEFYKIYPLKLGITQNPLFKVHIGKQIGGKNFYFVEETIISPPFTPHYILLPMEQ